MSHRTRLSRLALSLGCVMGLGLASVHPAAAEPSLEVPVVESVRSSARNKDVDPDAVVSLHAVRRTAEATIVYYSIGFATDSKEDRFLSSYLGGRVFTTGTVTEEVNSEAAIIDREHKTIYTPLIKDVQGCVVCTDEELSVWTAYSPAEQAFVGHVGLPPLPAGVSRVSVMVGGRLFTDVPVEDGLLEPQVPYPAKDTTVLLGTGWPTVELSKAATADDPKKFSIHPLTQNIEQAQVREREQTDKVQFDLSAKVLFDKDKAIVKSEGKKAIEALASKLKGRSQGTLEVTGYTDNLGSDEHGLRLSKQRAEAVAAILKPLLPPGVKLVTAGKGEADPIASNETEAGREQNRRVTITVKG